MDKKRIVFIDGPKIKLTNSECYEIALRIYFHLLYLDEDLKNDIYQILVKEYCK